MTDALPMMTLREMAARPVRELRSLAQHVPCHFYALALGQVASALESHALGDAARAQLHIARAKTAMGRALAAESERVAECQRLMVERGEVCETGVHRGIGAHWALRETHKATGEVR